MKNDNDMRKHFDDMEVLFEAIETVRQREQEYGPAIVKYKELARRWSGVLKREITPLQVILMMMHLKLLRLENNQEHHDTMVDIAGYAEVYARVNK